MSYKVIVRPLAEKFILRLNESDYGAIVERLRSLAEEPRPPAVRMVGAGRFELPTSWSRTKRATGLRYAPVTTPSIIC